MPLVSVLIPAYNAENMISRAIDSAISQTFTDIEIIVVDDASEDDTAALVCSRANDDQRIRLVRRETNGGPAATRNAGLKAASGEWIALLDADDMMLPERIGRMLLMATAGDVLLADNLEMYDIHADEVVKLGIDPSVIGSGLRLDSAAFVTRCMTNLPDAIDFGLLKPLLRVSHIHEHGIAYDETIRHAEDFNFYLDMLMAGGHLLVLPQAYYRYTERTGSLSGKKSGVSATKARYDLVEAQTRVLAADGRYLSVKTELNARADALQSLVRVAEYNRHSRIRKLALLPTILGDKVMRTYIGAQISARLGRLWSR